MTLRLRPSSPKATKNASQRMCFTHKARFGRVLVVRQYQNDVIGLTEDANSAKI